MLLLHEDSFFTNMENNLGNLYAGGGVVLSRVVIVDAVGQELIHHLGHVGGDTFHLKIK